MFINLVGMLFWYSVAWTVRGIMFFTYNRLMLVLVLITVPLIWYDYHEMQLVLYALSGH